MFIFAHVAGRASRAPQDGLAHFLAGCGLTALLLWPTGFALSAETVEAQVERDDDAFHIYFEILIDAPIGKVKNILSDYAHLQDLSPTITRSEILSGVAGGDATIDLTLRPCVWVLCKTIRKVSTVNINIFGAIVYNTLPEFSDFEFGREQVLVNKGSASNQTRVTYNAKLVPKFFVPPLVGAWLIRKHIVQNLKTSAERVEQRARQ